jgi:hypothetical protein
MRAKYFFTTTLTQGFWRPNIKAKKKTVWSSLWQQAFADLLFYGVGEQASISRSDLFLAIRLSFIR